MNFNEIPLKESLLRALEDRGFESATDIQSQAIPLLIEKDTDFVGQAQTGTGKTAAFSLPLLHRIDGSEKNIQAIILSPTRELANQINDEIKKFSTFETVKTMSVYGGTAIDNQIRNLKKIKPQIVVGTPGRVLDLINRGVLKLEKVKYAVLDEADEMLDMGFLDDVKEILAQAENKKTWMFSATMPPAILDLIKNYLDEPEIVRVQKKTLSNDNITQKFYLVRDQNMREAVCRLLDAVEDYYGIIFTKTKLEASSLCDELNLRGYLADSLHGDMDQKHRDVTMRKFKDKKVKLLVCTDVAARGIDVDHLTHVFNYGLPQDLESYVHRIGRTGRAGQKGLALSVVSPSEIRKISALERLTKAKIERERIPSVDTLKGAMVRRKLNHFEEIFEELEGDDSLDDSFSIFAENFDHLEKEQVLRAMYMSLFADNLKRFEMNPIIDMEPKQRGERGERGARGEVRADNRGNIRCFVNYGRDDGAQIASFLDAIAGELKIDQRKIRNVQLKDKFSFIDIPIESGKLLINGEEQVFIGNKKLRFEATKERSRDGGRSGDRGGRFSRGGDRGGRGGDRGGDRSGDRGGRSERGGRGGFGNRRSSTGRSNGNRGNSRSQI
ncbi:DEAD/DEAH box helicase [Halobacteriovorax sp. DA5]|uniref:DEAD/DEAH box helicase n=1 Tax=Halobacteriovorax sp. DA5 TaxID=2067553 RepID=UPI000CD2339D|nr:DEAD/DEAH box helicase [Halobacteriovorax sp. DA5]POB12868.1 ATP-dependent RNA helicase [Halobacteriovorax sp. DA5]